MPETESVQPESFESDIQAWREGHKKNINRIVVSYGDGSTKTFESLEEFIEANKENPPTSVN